LIPDARLVAAGTNWRHDNERQPPNPGMGVAPRLLRYDGNEPLKFRFRISS